MDKVEILARVRTFLDEESEVFYDNDLEVYPALSLAQTEMTKQIADKWKERQLALTEPKRIPLAVQPLLTTEKTAIATLGISTSIAGDPIQITSCQWDKDGAIDTASPYAIELAGGGDAQRMIHNSLLSDGVYFWYTSDLVSVNPPSADDLAEVEIIFIKTPVDITSAVDPSMHSVAHDAIAERALWILMKDRETEQAMAHLQLYGSLLEGLIV